MVISWWITRNILEQLPIHGWFYLRVVIFHRYFLVYFFGKPLDLLSWPNFLYLGIWEPGSLFRVFLTTEVIKELDRGDCGWPWTPMDPSQVGLSVGLSRAIGDSKQTFYGNLNMQFFFTRKNLGTFCTGGWGTFEDGWSLSLLSMGQSSTTGDT